MKKNLFVLGLLALALSTGTTFAENSDKANDNKQYREMRDDGKMNNGDMMKGGKMMGHGMELGLIDAAQALGIKYSDLKTMLETKKMEEILSSKSMTKADFQAKVKAIRESDMKSMLSLKVATGTITQLEADAMFKTFSEMKMPVMDNKDEKNEKSDWEQNGQMNGADKGSATGIQNKMNPSKRIKKAMKKSTLNASATVNTQVTAQ